jgi:predicted transcriptional regulator
MPKENIEVEKEFTKRESKSLNRFDNAIKISTVLKSFFEKGFRNLDSIRAILSFYYPKDDFSQLYDFWHLRIYDEKIFTRLENVLEKLKAE